LPPALGFEQAEMDLPVRRGNKKAWQRVSALSVCKSYPVVSQIAWASLLSTVVRVETRVEGRESVEARYFVCNKKIGAMEAGRLIRAHWGVESTHWHMDVSMGEDKTPSKSLAMVRKALTAKAIGCVKMVQSNMVVRAKKALSSKRSAAAKKQSFSSAKNCLKETLAGFFDEYRDGFEGKSIKNKHLEKIIR
jgi:predicted transposase YbfD/YdcC